MKERDKRHKSKEGRTNVKILKERHKMEFKKRILWEL
jgi:hypothetical protein